MYTICMRKQADWHEELKRIKRQSCHYYLLSITGNSRRACVAVHAPGSTGKYAKLCLFTLPVGLSLLCF